MHRNDDEYKILSASLTGNAHFGDTSIDGRIIWTLKDVWGREMDSAASGKYPVVGV
jgi:hypothetical protein